MGLEYVPTFATRIKRIFVGLIFTKHSMVINQKLGWSSKTKVLTFIETMCPGRFTGHRGWGTFLLEILVAKMVVTIPIYYICIYIYPNTFWGSNWCNWIPFPPPETKALEGFLVWLEDGFPGSLGYSKLGDLTLRWRILSNLQDGYLASWGRLMTKVADQKLPTFAGSECIGVCCFPWKEDPGWCRTRSPGCLRNFLSQNESWSASSTRNAHWDRLIQLCQDDQCLGCAAAAAFGQAARMKNSSWSTRCWLHLDSRYSGYYTPVFCWRTDRRL